MAESFRGDIDKTALIRSVLDGYPFSSSIFRELLQNSDDSGATTQTFILDLRTHEANYLIHPALRDCQGPALIAINDRPFLPKDWEAIKNMYTSSKLRDASKTGKYGIGFRSVYHVTDTPLILSGSTLLVFDPHGNFAEEGTDGLAIDFVQKHDRCSDSVAAMNAMNYNLSEAFEGAIVRLPLRTQHQASTSKIRPGSAVSPESIRELLVSFSEDLLDVSLLFLRHVKQIVLKIIEPDGNSTVVATSTFTPKDIREVSFPGSALENEQLMLCTLATHTLTTVREVTWAIVRSETKHKDISEVIADRIPRSAETISAELIAEKLSGDIALAVPLDMSVLSDFKGRLFTILPLPIITPFPCHMHAFFALTPSRQSLRNPSESGTPHDSRDRLMVEWNRVIFDTLLPRSWARLLEVIRPMGGAEDTDPFCYWPGESSEIQDIPVGEHLMKEIYAANRVVWPLAPRQHILVALESSGPPFFTTLEALDGSAVLEVVVLALELGVVVLPAHLYQLARIAHLPFKPFTQPELHRTLIALNRTVAALDAVSKFILLEYLAAPGKTNLVAHLPLFPLVKEATFVSLPLEGQQFTLVDARTASLFNTVRGHYLLAAGDMPESALRLLSNRGAATQLGVAPLTVATVKECLDAALADCDRKSSGCPMPQYPPLEWFVEFWQWYQMDIPGTTNLIHHISDLPLIPTESGRLRSIVSGALILPLSQSVGETELIAALRSLGVPILHSAVTFKHRCPSQLKRVDQIIDLLDLIGSENSLPTTIIRPEILLKHIEDNIKESDTSRLNLTALKSLPIHPVLKPGLGSLPVYEAVDPDCTIFVVQRNTYTPMIPNTVLLDGSALGHRLSSILSKDAVLDELALLEMTISVLEQQNESLFLTIFARIDARRKDLSSGAWSALSRAEIVTAGTGDTRRAACDLINPASDLIALYNTDHPCLPTKRFGAGGDLAEIMGHLGLYISALSPAIVSERTAAFAASPCQETTKKAVKLLHLLDAIDPRRASEFASVLDSDTAWLPLEDGTFANRKDCRDRSQSDLCDLVLPIVPYRIKSLSLRKLLSWAQLPFDNLCTQMKRVCASHQLDDIKHRKLCSVISAIASSAEYAEDKVAALAHSLELMRWIPTFDGRVLASFEVFLSKTPYDRVISQVQPALLKKVSCRRLLTTLGCKDRHVNQLSLLFYPDLSVAMESVSLMLTDLSGSLDGLVLGDLEICVPDQNKVMRPTSAVYFNNGVTVTADEAKTRIPCHRSVDAEVARKLGIPFASSLAFEWCDEEDGQRDMHEDLCQRIKNVLADYNIKLASNEYIANAADAGSSAFAFLLDQRSYPSERLVAPEMAKYQSGPALLLFNDSQFSETDFHAILKIGEGSKRGSHGAIGKFGLGALSMFHFTDLVTLVSGDRIMWLDPTKSAIPQRHGKPLQAARLRTHRHNPDQLEPFRGVFGFVPGQAFSGTIFRLPLRTEALKNSLSGPIGLALIQELLMSYKSNASLSLFFTNLEEISAYERDIDGMRSLWKVQKERTHVQRNIDTLQLRIYNDEAERPSSQESWVVGNLCCRTPPPFADTRFLRQYRLMHTKTDFEISVGIALQLDDVSGSERRLFCSLPLLETTTLPVHINAPFILSSDRCHVIFDRPESPNAMLTSRYNHWLVTSVIPPLYSTLLSSEQLPKNRLRWWPAKSSGDIDRSLTEVLYGTEFRLTPEPIFKDVTGEFIPPSEARFLDPHSLEWSTLRRLLTLKALTLSGVVDFPSKLASRLCSGENALKCLDPLTLRLLIKSRDCAFRELIRLASLKESDLEQLIRFFKAKDVDWTDLPLLVMSDGSVTTAKELHVYALKGSWNHLRRDNIICELRRDRILSPKYQESMVASLADCNQISLVGETSLTNIFPAWLAIAPTASWSVDQRTWISNFWDTSRTQNFQALKGILDASAAFPLFSSVDGSYFISLEYCKSGPVLMSSLDPITDCLRALGVLFLAPDVLVGLPAFGGSTVHLSMNLTNVLRCLRLCSAESKLNSTPFARHTELLHPWIVGALRSIRSLYGQSINASDKDYIFRLPIWPGQTAHRGIVRCRGFELTLLPLGVDIDIALPFLPPGMVFANSGTFPATLDRKVVAIDLLENLSLPTQLPSHKVGPYLELFNALRSSLTTRRQLMCPDGSRTLRPISSFFSRDVPLFYVIFQNSDLQPFIHPRFQTLEPQLTQFGLQRQLSYENFVRCAAELKGRIPMPSDAEADAMYQAFNDSLPLLIQFSPAQWGSLSSYAFIRRSPRRRQYCTFEAAVYALELPTIVSPAKIVREEFEPICWTQRGLFREYCQPSALLLQANPTFGQPTCEEVVAHLVILATEVALDHPKDPTLMSDLKATYKWLDSHAKEAETSLRRHQATKTYLNIDDWDLDEWRWFSARQLVLDLSYDSEAADLYGVRGVLSDYLNLMRHAGAEQLKNVEFRAKARTESPLREKFQEMRNEGQLLDVKLIATEEENEEDRRSFKVHRAFLAACSPHLREVWTSGFIEANNDVVDILASSKCLEAVINFIYSGVIMLPPLREDALIHLLLEMLELAHYWEMPNAVQAVAQEIVERKLVRPWSHEAVRESAQGRSAELVQYCDEFIAKNPWVNKLDDAESDSAPEASREQDWPFDWTF
ncbi:hypothetical protein SISNIDRAFT_484117 [Sistotremastrum niveocremeum HHB9708]|uniref:BTB domain-containing protein n=1 Tax=Sistotremastrum niveocremeum HHB9708 TaxID=1314777 RepID=A0A164WQ16_9AGAM|nr:hypothetical protein SISNIDRAFT_484117 [Sistotremastrum niveocremeum HHB9708]